MVFTKITDPEIQKLQLIDFDNTVYDLQVRM